MLEFRDITKSYHLKDSTVCALDNVSANIGESGMIVVLGKSGCGKSTLLSVLAGINSADKGEVCYDGKNICTFSEKELDALRNSYIGFIFQETNLLQNFTVEENLRIAVDLQNFKPSAARIERALIEVGLSRFGKRRVNELSGGQRQRVSIARAILKNSKIILADEPTGNLDSKTGEEVFGLLKNISRSKPVILVTHDRTSAFKFADRILEMSDGKIVSDLTRTELEGCFCDKEKLTVRLPQRRLETSEIEELKNFLADLANEDLHKLDFTVTDTQMAFTHIDHKPVSSKSEYKAVMPKIPFRFSLKVARSNIKTSKAGLIFTTLILIFAIGLFGLAQIIYSYDINKASLLTFEENKITAINARQGVYDDFIGAIRTEQSFIFNNSFEEEYKDLFGIAPNRVYELFVTWSLDKYSRFTYKPDCRKLLVIENEGDLIRLGYKGLKHGNYLNDPSTSNDKNFLELLIPDVLLYMLLYYYPECLYYAYTVETYEIFIDVFADEIDELSIIEKTWIFGTGQNSLKGLLEANYHLPYSDFDRLMDALKPYTEKLTEFIIKANIMKSSVRNGAAFECKLVGMIDTGLLYLFEEAKAVNGVKSRREAKTYHEHINENLYESICHLVVADKESFENYYDFYQVYANNSSGQYINNGELSANQSWWTFRRYSLLKDLAYYAIRDYSDLWLRNGYTSEGYIDGMYGFAAQAIINPDGSEGLIDNDVVVPLSVLTHLFGENALERYFINKSDNTDINIDYVHRDYSGNTVVSVKLRVVGVVYNDGEQNTHNHASDFIVSDQTLFDLYFGYPHYYSYFIPLSSNQNDNLALLELMEKYDMYHISAVSEAIFKINTLMKIVVKVFEIIIVFVALLCLLQIFNFSRRSVKKRTKEIGILRAMGASKLNVAKIFLFEVLLIIVVAAVFSIVFVAFGAQALNSVIIDNSVLITNITDLSGIMLFSVSPSSIAITFLFCVFLAALSSVIPLYAISRMKPFEAMRNLGNE